MKATPANCLQNKDIYSLSLLYLYYILLMWNICVGVFHVSSKRKCHVYERLYVAIRNGKPQA